MNSEKLNISQKSILVIAGETSGDMRGAELVSELKKDYPGWQFFGIGGDKMAQQGVELLYHSKEMAFLGFFEVIRHLPFIKKVFNRIRQEMLLRKPDLILLIDYPGFNLRFADKAKKDGFRVCYYISPQVWAWGRGRVKKMAKTIDRMIVILPFEEAFFKDAGMDVIFSGHPLKETAAPALSKNEFFEKHGLEPNQPLLALLPGSRKQEVKHLLPAMLSAADLIKREIPDCRMIIGAAPGLESCFYQNIIGMSNAMVLENAAHDIMAYSDAALVASGTATLETAIFNTPMVILYKMSAVSYWIGRSLVKLKNIGLVNIVAGKTIVPELIQNAASPKNIAREAVSLLTDEKLQKRIKSDLKDVSASLGEPGAARRAANAVTEMMITKKEGK